MNWLLWRQHRSQVLVTGVLLGLFAVAVAVTGVHMAHSYDHAVRNCTTNGTCSLVRNIFHGDGAIVDLVHLSIVVPVLVGVLGVTLITLETEHATNILAWTQTVTRRRWLFTKIAAVLLATLVLSVAVAALVTLWSGTPNSLYGNRFEGTQFDTQNIAPIAFALFAVALGIAMGSVLRRTLPALATTIGIYIGVRVLVAVYLRPHYMTALTHTYPLNAAVNAPSGSWTLNQHIIDPTGHDVGSGISIPTACQTATRGGIDSCLTRLGYRNSITYQPPSHYWHFQITESVLYLTLSVGLITLATVHTLRHDA